MLQKLSTLLTTYAMQSPTTHPHIQSMQTCVSLSERSKPGSASIDIGGADRVERTGPCVLAVIRLACKRRQ